MVESYWTKKNKSIYFLVTIFLVSIHLIGGVVAESTQHLGALPLQPTPWDLVPRSPVFGEGKLYSICYVQNYELDATDATNGAFIWNFSIGNEMTEFYEPIIGNKIVYVVGTENRLFALDAANGTPLWNYTADLPFASSPVIANGIIYGESRFSRVFALNADTGDLIWKQIIGKENTVGVPGIMPTPIIDKGQIYVEGFDNNYEIYALDALTGRKTWNFSSNGSRGSENPVYFILSSEDMIYVTHLDDIIAINSTNGLQIWNSPILQEIYQEPLKSYTGFFVAGRDRDQHGDAVAEVDAATGKQEWKFTPENRTKGVNYWISSLVSSNGTLFFGTDNSGIYAIDTFSGKPIWNYVTDNRVQFSPVVSDDVVYAGDDSGNIYAINAITGENIWIHPIGSSLESIPLLSQGIVFVEDNDHRIYALNESTGDEMWDYKIGDTPIYSAKMTQSMPTATSMNSTKSPNSTSITTLHTSSTSFFLPFLGFVGVIIIGVAKKVFTRQ